MSGWLGRSTSALALTVGALALGGCGGSGHGGSAGGGTSSGAPLSAKAWQSQISSISNQLSAAFAPVRTQGRNPSTWFTLAAKLRQINAQVAAIKPPPVATSVNSAIVSGLSPLPGEASAVGNDLKNGNKLAARSDGVALERSLLALLNKIAGAVSKLRASGG